MMKKFKYILIIFLAIILASCSNKSHEELSDLILMPKLDEPLLQGSRQVTNVSDITDNKINSVPEVGDKLYISKNLVAIDEEYAFPPTFTSKYVNLNDYLKNRGYNFDNVNTKENVVVINASQGQLFSRDFIKRSDDEIFYIADDNVISLTKLSNNIDPDIINKYTKKAAKERVKASDGEEVVEDVSLLLGVRERVDNKNGTQDYNYYTYFIKFLPEDKIKYKKSKDIFIRNQDEFWKVRSSKNNFSGLYDNIEAFPIRFEEEMDREENIERYSFKNFDMNIKLNYVNRDYISFSYSTIIDGNSINKYGFIETNELEENRLLTIDDYTGEQDATEQYRSLMINEARSKVPDINPNDIIIDNTNFGAIRDQGVWITQSSIYTKNAQEGTTSQIPIRNAIGEDRLNPFSTKITRDQVRNINSQFKDYHVLNNQKFIIIETADEILLHKINDGLIEKRPFFSIQTKNSTSFVSIDEQAGVSAETLENAFINFNTIIESN